MIEQKIKKLFEEVGLGNIAYPIESVSGGFLHRMYKVRAVKKTYAVKHVQGLWLDDGKRTDMGRVFESVQEIRLCFVYLRYG